jgi:hypothetical protein
MTGRGLRSPVAIALLGSVVVLVACQGRQASRLPEVPSDAPPAPETLANGKVLSTPDDHSLTADEYLKLGMPAADRAWSGEEMGRAAKALATLAKDDAGKLPRYRSERSGVLFARMTSLQNLEIYHVKKLSLDLRMSPALAYFGATNDVLQLYVSSFMNGVTGDSELMELIGSDLRTAAVLLQLVDEELPTLKQSDPKNVQRIAGLEKMRNGLATMTAGALTTLTEASSYRTSERARLLRYLQETLPKIVPHLSPAAQSETQIRIETLARDQTLKPLQPRLTELALAVQGVVKQ